MEELASLTVAANTALVIMELSAKLSHVVALNVFLFKQLILSMGIRAIITEFAFTEVNDVLAHFSLSFHLNGLVKLLSFLNVIEKSLLLLSCGLAIVIVFF